MKVLTRRDQQHSYKDLVEIIKVLAKDDSDEATDAIVSVFNLASVLGVNKDLLESNSE